MFQILTTSDTPHIPVAKNSSNYVWAAAVVISDSGFDGISYAEVTGWA